MWKRELSALPILKAQRYDGLPHGTGISNPVRDIAEQREKIRTIIRGKEVEIERQKAEITEYIMTIDNSITRQIFYLRHVKLYSWAKIAHEVGGDNTPDGVRKAHDRFLLEK